MICAGFMTGLITALFFLVCDSTRESDDALQLVK